MKISSKNSLFLLTLIAGMEFLPVSRACADHPPGTLFVTWGFLRDDLGNPVENVEVVGDNFIGDNFPSITDSNGGYSVIFPYEGNYRIQVNCSQLTALGYGCIAPVLVAQEADPIQHDFVVSLAATSLQITNTSLPKGNVSASYQAQLGASGGPAPYTWQLTGDSPPLPPGLSLSSSGLIAGTPTTNNLFAFKVQVTDANSAVTNKVLFITVNRQPVLLTPVWRANQFTMRLFGAADQNYTIQMSTNLSSTNWTTLFVTNNLNASSYLVNDLHATNKQRFYRVLVGP